MEGNEQLAVIIPMLKNVGARITPQQLEDSTPCASFSVTGVLEHMTGLASGFAPAFRGEAPPVNEPVAGAAGGDAAAGQERREGVPDPGGAVGQGGVRAVPHAAGDARSESVV